ncbi:MAG: hypothetical protein WCA64_03965 [Gallionella sp.]
MEIAISIPKTVAKWSGGSQICRAGIAGIFPEKQNIISRFEYKE